MSKERNELLESNTDAINIFYSDDNDVNAMSTFLFEMMASFTKTDPGYTNDHKAQCITNFESLHTLINSIVPVGVGAEI